MTSNRPGPCTSSYILPSNNCNHCVLFYTSDCSAARTDDVLLCSLVIPCKRPLHGVLQRATAT